MTRVTVDIPGRPYPVVIGRGALRQLPRLLRDMDASSVAVVTDRPVAGLWAAALRDELSGLGVRVAIHSVEPGEQAKSLGVLTGVVEFLETSAMDRRGVVLAVGGGTIGDLAGFAAAVWLRGVRYVQVPTTLLAMVDSSVGGKTGVNLARTKNAVGSFWQPSLVVSDLSVLDTLPQAMYLDAFGEIAKYAVAMDGGLAERMEADGDALLERSDEVLEDVVARCVELKAGVVAADEREGGLRAILNYGHTAGHALESASGFAAPHGGAVAFGMGVAARIGAEMGLCDAGLISRQEALLGRFALPGALPLVTAEAVMAALPHDKKSVGGRVRWVLPLEIGRAQVGVEAPGELVSGVIRALLP